MRSKLLLIVLLGLGLGGLAALVSTDGGPGTATAVQSTGKALIGGPFSLVDQTGKRVTDQDFKGRKTLVFFGFTSCPDICPTGLAAMAAALDALGEKAESLTPIFITVDPERDTPAKMAEYVKSFHPRLIGLTGTPEEVAAATRTYRVYARKVPDPATPGSYSVDHSSFFYLMDESGAYIRHFTHSTDGAKLAAELAKSL
ncbi:MAG: SCO family protein [Hyphomicrobium sp.]